MDLIDYFATNVATSSWYRMLQAYNVADAVFKERWIYLPMVTAMKLTDRYLQELILPNILRKGLQSCANCIYNIIFYGNLTME
eukprot:gene28167-37068_t